MKGVCLGDFDKSSKLEHLGKNEGVQCRGGGGGNLKG